ncbi:MAG TPA: glucose-1-phosphate adenylyltransferase [Pirellulales bacterium]|jgi:glucose-1-phosphate adenylyltransferase|nr:glucose-1-phosphate adenylyltransferase [Pirellulales bacterium]
MRNCITLVLGGGRGTRLYPLTKLRSKPAVPLAGKYRLIDIPLSNCLNSGLNRIYVLTQFNSVSLHRHIRRTYTFDPFNGGFVELLAAQQTLDNADWYQGTADAVRQNLRYLQQPGIDHVLVLSGDQLYRMDYNTMLATHEKSRADVTIAALPVERQQAASFGIMRLDDSGRVMGFLEKPKTEAELALVHTDPAWIDAHGVASRGRDCLASMGIYLFNRDKLIDLLTKTDYRDFGKEIFPASIRTHRVQVHLFDGYWEDIGTIKSFYEANLDLTQPNPPFDLHSAVAPIYTRSRFLPPSQVDGVTITQSLISDGCKIAAGARIENSVIGLRCQIGKNVTIRNSVVMGNDFFQTPAQIAADAAAGIPPVAIGEGTVIERAIIDKNCRIGRHARITNDSGAETSPDNGSAMICDGIVVVPKETTIADGWKMAR